MMYHKSHIVWRVFFVYLLAVLLPNGVAQAQNPTVAACGLPAAGDISQTVTYTLVADCTQTGRVRVISGTTLTINGGGFTIDGSALRGSDSILETDCDGTATASDVTFLGDGADGKGAVHAAGDVILSNVTIRESDRTGLTGNPCTAGATFTLTNILIETVAGTYFHYEESGSAINANGDTDITVTNLVIRDHYGGNAAINVWSGASITINGCFSYDRIAPQVFHAGAAPRLGTITNNSSGACSGTIGNGDPAVVNVPAPQPAACGLPAQGYLQVSAHYSFTADCQQTGVLLIPAGGTVTIRGNGHAINAPAGVVAVRSAADLTIENAILIGTSETRFVIGYLPEHTLVVNNSVFSGNYTAVTLADHRAVFNSVVFQNNSNASTGASDSTAIRVVRQGVVTIRDSVFTNNTGGAGAIWIGAPFRLHLPPSLLIECTITWEGNSPANIAGDLSYVTDASTPNVCGPPVAGQQKRRAAVVAVARTPGCQSTDTVQAIPMGVVACLFRHTEGGGNTVLSVYGVDEESVGYHLLTVAQGQLDAASGESIIGVSPDGRALVVMWPDRNVTVKVGPDHERKILHLTFAGGLHGRLINTTTTYGEAPGLPYLTGGATSAQTCHVTTNDVLNLRLQPQGAIIGVVANSATLTATARTNDWFQVDDYGVAGWLSADYVTPIGDCA